MLLPCAHQFHGKCILRWVESNYSCPLCRQEISQFVPLNADDPDIHQKFVEIWERHHYGLPSESEDEDAPVGPKDRFDASKNSGPPTVSLDEVKTAEEDEQKSPDGPPPPNDPPVTDENTIHRIGEAVAEVIDTAPEVQVGTPPTPRRERGIGLFLPTTSVLRLRSHAATAQDPICVALREARYKLRALARRARDAAQRQRSRLRLKGRFGRLPKESKEEPVVSITVPLPRLTRPTSYRLNETLEAGFIAGALTAGLLSATERPTNLYPLIRATVPNVAIFFTVYEDLKGRVLSQADDRGSKFWKRTACAAGAAAVGQLPNNRFKLTVPLRFGLQFGFFEHFKDQCCIQRSLPVVDHSQLSPSDIALCALSGGVLAASAAFPLEIYMGYMATTTGTAEAVALGPTYRTFMKRFLPGCVFTAMSFEFGRRWIHKHEHEE